jgi:hypothetical protein
MIPNTNIDGPRMMTGAPIFQNLNALRNPMPTSTGAPIFQRGPIGVPVAPTQFPVAPQPTNGAPIFQQAPVGSLPMQPGMPGQMPQGNLGNMNALMQMFAQRPQSYV